MNPSIALLGAKGDVNIARPAMRSFDALSALCRLAVALLALFVLPPQVACAKDANGRLAELGERLYMKGIDTSGKPVAAIDLSGQRVFAPQFHCVSCHRPSGFGSKEGGVFIPPIAAPVLYQAVRPNRTRAFNAMYFQQQSNNASARVYQARTRPAYDLASLGRLLRDGIDPAGQPVPRAMPHFVFSRRDVAALDAYLRTLSAKPDPGVDDQAFHFAVIVSDRTPATTRRSLLDTTRVFVERMNRNTVSEQARPNFSPFYRSDFASFWRNWQLDVWELHGAEQDWPRQLAEHYAAHPVFAVIGAATSGSWQPIAAFCDTMRLPCLFPLTDLPVADPSESSYTIYSYGGLPLEARAMAAYLQRAGRHGKVVQLAATGPHGSVPADHLARALAGVPAFSVRTVPVAPGGWAASLLQVRDADIIVLWPGAEADAAVAAIKSAQTGSSTVLLASSALDPAVAQLQGSALAGRVRIMHPTELPTVVNPHSYRVRAWLDARRVAVDPPEEQFQVYYALSVLEKAVMEIQGDFSRRYLIEEIEMIAESNLNPGVYPNLTLGPGQRVASRGSYVVRLDRAASEGYVADGEWLVP